MRKAKAGRPIGVPPSPRPAEFPTRRQLRRATRWRLPVVSLIIAMICVIGAGLLLYPSIAAWLTQYEQSQRVIELSEGVTDLGAATLEQKREEARDYNARIVGGGVDIAANERLPLASEPDQAGDYNDVLSADSSGLMARIKIPTIGLDLPVYHGTSESVLEHGVGHLEGTAVPIGGRTTHSVLTAHRGLATSELFTNLDRVKVDDTFTIEVFGEVLVYRVLESIVVEPEDTESLFVQKGRDLITLVTCTPLGINSHRILVTGERVIPTPEDAIADAGSRPDIPTFPWWAVIALGTLIVASLYVWWAGRPVRPRAARPAAEREQVDAGA